MTLVRDPLGRTASRVIDDAQIEEEAAFFGSTARPLFGVTHRPVGDPTGGVLICPPLYAELLRNYRREVVLARALAQRGLVVQRFHYGGTGHSAEAPSETTFETMVDDARICLERLSSYGDLFIVGTRLGGTVAAVLAAETEVRGLALWEPVTDPERYLREVFRGRLVSDVKRGETARVSAVDELRAVGRVDVLGYEISASIYESVLARTVEDFDHVPERVLIVQFGGSSTPRAEHKALMARWRSRGVDVAWHRLEGAEPWWFGTAPETIGDDPDRAREVVEVTSRWVQRNLST